MAREGEILLLCPCLDPKQPPAVKKQEELEELKDRAQIRLMLWLGLEKDQTTWTEHVPGGDLATFAETVSFQSTHGASQEGRCMAVIPILWQLEY